ncbi:MAG: peptidoglycan DD-metalloendopeptidase family protein, partial [Candidatus Competibacteraceae bacterium]|nr:peptidoglycan DD-metalloendopeptidase family protein [Candidatus Competibacteraceae bacterium]
MALGFAVLIAGCAGTSSWGPSADQEIPASYRVKRGDTLSTIAMRYDLDYKDLADWNQLDSPDLIYAGQRLRLVPPGAPNTTTSSTSAQRRTPPTQPTRDPPLVRTTVQQPTGLHSNTTKRVVGRLTWLWPTDGEVLRRYQPELPGGKGIQIGGLAGQPVRAAASGQVVYSGSGLPGYGRLIIVKHSGQLLSAYGYLGEILVKEGEDVTSGQSIAVLGIGRENRPMLHFEIRRNGQPVNPLSFYL